MKRLLVPGSCIGNHCGDHCGGRPQTACTTAPRWPHPTASHAGALARLAWLEGCWRGHRRSARVSRSSMMPLSGRDDDRRQPDRSRAARRRAHEYLRVSSRGPEGVFYVAVPVRQGREPRSGSRARPSTRRWTERRRSSRSSIRQAGVPEADSLSPRSRKAGCVRVGRVARSTARTQEPHLSDAPHQLRIGRVRHALSGDAAAVSALENVREAARGGQRTGALLRVFARQRAPEGRRCATRRRAPCARRRAGSGLHRRVEALRQGARRGRPRASEALARLSNRQSTVAARQRATSRPEKEMRVFALGSSDDSRDTSSASRGSHPAIPYVADPAWLQRPLPVSFHAAVGKGVGALVARMVVVALDPVPADRRAARRARRARARAPRS